ncbi:MAG: TIGR03067 domain-containing protein [Planctomycetes bacterium]|nr:TIGR03067 domain-containing protein [Planctomycetota bacterium]
MQRRILGFLLIIGCVLPVTANAGDDDAKQLQGTWQLVAARVGAKDAAADRLKDVKMIFHGDKVTYLAPNETDTATFSIDATKKPRQMNTLVQTGKSKGEARLAIYELNGDNLKIRWGKADKRPRGFGADDGENFIYMELKRVSDGK